MKLDSDVVRGLVDGGMSFSAIARKFDINVGNVSYFCKVNNIVSKHVVAACPSLSVIDVYNEYVSGKSLDFLHKKYSVPVARIKRNLRRSYPDIKFRTMDEAKRPSELNDRGKLSELASKFSFRKIAKMLHVKANTVCSAAKRFGIESMYDFRSEDVPKDVLYKLYVDDNKRISQIAEELGQSYNCILRKIRKYGFDVSKPGGFIRPSRHELLNNRDWLYNKYIVEVCSMADIADIVGTTIGNISHHLLKHKIKVRSKSEYLNLLMKKSHGVKSNIYDFTVDSKLELSFLKSIGNDHKILRNVELSFNNSVCFIDFCVDGRYVEVKSKEQSITPGPNRRRLVKQWLICKHNDIDLSIWNGDYYSWQGLTDVDVYFCNWKLFFSDPGSCSDWLIKYGFHPLEYSIGELCSFFNKVISVKEGMELNANYPNDDVIKLIKHFSPHFWGSTHKGYNPISAAWGFGNTSVLRDAVERMWDEKCEVNIYRLVEYIRKFYKDFTTVSIFKPWIASYIYKKYLPNGGLIVDPCIGWGGRLLGCVGGDYRYYGIDLNKNCVNSSIKLYDFFKSRFKECSFEVNDSSKCDFPDGDLLFTSPPYDDTELYCGIDSSLTKTVPILENILSKFGKTVVLNVPKRQYDLCLGVAKKYNRVLVDVLQMKTCSFMGREKTFEPILIFK